MVSAASGAVGLELAGLGVLRFPAECPLTDELLMRIGDLNEPWRFERSADGGLVVNLPAGGESGEVESELGFQLRMWWRGHRDGGVFGTSGGFRLGAELVMAPGAAWVSGERLAGLTRAELRGFPPVCPDFVVEVRSASQGLEGQQEKMGRWIASGTRLGVLVDPDDRLVLVYRPGRAVERLVRPSAWSAEPELAGFVIDFDEVWALIGEDD